MKALQRKLLSPFGRLSRGGLWRWAILYPVGLIILASLFDEYVLRIEYAPVDSHSFLPSWKSAFELSAMNVVYYLTIWPVTVLSIKRFHDVKMSGWWVIAFIPSYFLYSEPVDYLKDLGPILYLGTFYVILLVVLSFIQVAIRGTAGENRHGADPLDKD